MCPDSTSVVARLTLGSEPRRTVYTIRVCSHTDDGGVESRFAPARAALSEARSSAHALTQRRGRTNASISTKPPRNDGAALWTLSTQTPEEGGASSTSPSRAGKARQHAQYLGSRSRRPALPALCRRTLECRDWVGTQAAAIDGRSLGPGTRICPPQRS